MAHHTNNIAQTIKRGSQSKTDQNEKKPTDQFQRIKQQTSKQTNKQTESKKKMKTAK